MGDQVGLTIVIPVLDEAPNLRTLHREVLGALVDLDVDWEVVFVDDGSTDEGPQILAELAASDDRVRPISLDRNYGQSTAMVAGTEAARGTWVATLDGDLQNDPADLAVLWQAIQEGKADVVTGVREIRHDSWVRRASSKVANNVRNRISGDHVTDVGCSLRIFPRRALLEVARFEGMHRFLPTLFRIAGYTVIERPVNHRPRYAGVSKYGIHNRLWRGLADLYVVRRLRRRGIKYHTRALPSGDNPPQREENL